MRDHDGPGAPYRWSDPPADVAQANAAPVGRTAEVAAPGEVWTPDLQATLVLPVATPASPVDVTLSPRTTTGLAAPPRGTFADGNVYEVRVDAGVDTGRLLLRTPHEATGVVFSADGTAWTPLDAAVVSTTEVEVPFVGSGLYLALADHGAGAPAAATASAGVPLWSVGLLLAVSAAATRSSWRSATGRGRGTPRRSPASR